MSYSFDNRVFDMKQRIMAIFDNIGNNLPRHEELDRLEKLIRDELTQSFKNGIEVGKKRSRSLSEKVRKKES